MLPEMSHSKQLENTNIQIYLTMPENIQTHHMINTFRVIQ